MNEIDIVRDVSRKLDQAGIGYMLTGSMAMNYYAQPRMTRDIDVVVSLGPDDIDQIVALFEPEYYVSREGIRESVAHESIFNLIHHESVIKVDCIVRKDNDYRRVEFERRQKVSILDFTTYLVSKEDLIISKLVWAKDSHSELQLGDVRNLLATGTIRPTCAAGRVNWGSIQCLRSVYMTDTPPEINKIVREQIMARSGEERFVMGAQMFDAAIEMVKASLPRDISERELKSRLFKRVYGTDLGSKMEVRIKS